MMRVPYVAHNKRRFRRFPLDTLGRAMEVVCNRSTRCCRIGRLGRRSLTDRCLDGQLDSPASIARTRPLLGSRHRCDAQGTEHGTEHGTEQGCVHGDDHGADHGTEQAMGLHANKPNAFRLFA